MDESNNRSMPATAHDAAEIAFAFEMYAMKVNMESADDADVLGMFAANVYRTPEVSPIGKRELSLLESC